MSSELHAAIFVRKRITRQTRVARALQSVPPMKTAAAVVILMVVIPGCASTVAQPAPRTARPVAHGHIVAMEYDGVWYATEGGGRLDVNCAKETPCHP